MSGPLAGVRVVELAGIGALPFGVLQLADMGAAVVRVERPADVPEDPRPAARSSWDRGRRSIAVDLKQPEGVAVVLRLLEQADVCCESFRPGVAERLGVGPDVVLTRNPRIVYGRLTGWGREGPLADTAGHSLNFEALTGVIRGIGPRGGPPVPLLQVLGDFAGGGLLLAYGITCALFEAQRSGRGQVVDAAMLDGVFSLTRVFHLMDDLGLLGETGTNLFDGGAPFYAVYECADGEYLSVASIEPHFYRLLLDGLALVAEELPDQHDEAHWPELRDRLAAVFRTRSRDEWCERFEGTDACVAPVLAWGEARRHPHTAARGLFDDDGALRPVPELSRTPGRPGRAPAWPGADTDAVLADLGYTSSELAAFRTAGVIR